MGIEKSQMGQGLGYKVDVAAIPTENGLQSVNDFCSFPTKLYQKFDFGLYFKILMPHGLKNYLK